MNLSEKVGKRIRQFRIEKGLSQEELAFSTDLHQPQIYRLENGKQRFNSDQLEKISQVLGMPIIRFFEDDIEIGEDFDDVKLMEIFSQMLIKKRKTLIAFVEYLQNSQEDIDVDTLKKAIEFAKAVKKS